MKIKQTGKINFWGLILILMIIYVLFKIDIKDAIEGPKFQKNLSFIRETAVGIKDKLLVETKIVEAFKGIINKNFSEDYIFDTKNLNLIPSLDIQNLEEKLHIPENDYFNSTTIDYSDINTTTEEPMFDQK